MHGKGRDVVGTSSAHVPAAPTGQSEGLGLSPAALGSSRTGAALLKPPWLLLLFLGFLGSTACLARGEDALAPHWKANSEDFSLWFLSSCQAGNPASPFKAGEAGLGAEPGMGEVGLCPSELLLSNPSLPSGFGAPSLALPMAGAPGVCAAGGQQGGDGSCCSASVMRVEQEQPLAVQSFTGWQECLVRWSCAGTRAQGSPGCGVGASPIATAGPGCPCLLWSHRCPGGVWVSQGPPECGTCPGGGCQALQVLGQGEKQQGCHTAMPGRCHLPLRSQQGCPF